MDFTSLLFSFNGRINRAKWWLAILIYFVISVVIGILTFMAGQGMIMQVISIIVQIAIFISGLAAGAKRLHDRNKSGWWLVLFYVLPIVLFGIGMVIAIAGVAGGSGTTGVLGIVLYVAGFGVLIWALVELGCLRGTVGPNQYGPDPLAGP